MIHGYCAEAFSEVRRVFLENFTGRGELGAAFCVYLDGLPVVDLWGGFADEARTRPWERDTIVCMMSVGKAMAALGVHLLIDRGELELESPVARYWPDFAANGKDRTTVRQLIGHHAGLIYADDAPPGSLFDWQIMADALARQAPAWPAGTKGAYHSSTYGPLLAGLVFHVTGRPIGEFFQREIAEPWRIDFHFGVDPARHRIADYVVDPAVFAPMRARDTLIGRAYAQLPEDPDWVNSSAFREAQFPSLNGHGNARGVARIFGGLACSGILDDQRLLSERVLAQAIEEQWHEICGLTRRDVPMRLALGFLLNMPPAFPMGPNPATFGHAGIGGSFGFADPARKLGVAYSMNRFEAIGQLGLRGRALLDAVFEVLV